MKKLMRIFALTAVAALGLSACTGEKLVPDTGSADGKFVTVHFGAEAAIEGATKATLTTEDELTFKSAWENGDALSVEYISPETADNKIITATWNGTSFEAKGLPNETGAWDYTACYPKPDEKDSHIDFGGARTQKGSAYNSIYDVMIGNKSTKNSAAGKDDDGKDVVFNMTRKTAIAYFHLTGGPADEEVVSATLSVEGGFIASQHAYISNFAFAPTKDLTDITITFDAGTAPKASDFQLWYNVLPTTYTKMTLTVETANHTLTISRTAADNYATGKLYKVVKNIPAEKWVKKVTANDGSLEHPYTAAEAIAVIDASPKPSEGVTNQHVKGVVKAAPSFNATYSSLSYDIVSGEATLYIYSGRDLGNADFVGAEDLKAGDEVVVFGTLKKYTDKQGVVKYELDKTNYLISINGKTEIYRGLAVSGQKTAFTVGDAFEFGGKALQVWRGKEDVDVTATATFSGYNMSTEGKQTVTVKVGEETVTYEITVNPAGAALPITITKKISEMSGTTTNGTKVSSMPMDDVITLSASTTGNNGKVYEKGAEWRLYQSDKGTMTIASKAGYVIESITVTFTNKNSGTLLYNKKAITSGKAVSVSGGSVEFTLGNSSTATNGQIKVTAVSVTYKQQ